MTVFFLRTRGVSWAFLSIVLVMLIALGNIPTPNVVSALAAPTLNAVLISPGTITPNSTFTMTATFNDSGGGSNIDRIWLGFVNCANSPAEAYGSNFERNLANFFGLNIYSYTSTYSYQVAQINQGAYGCLGGQDALLPWGSNAPLINQYGTTELVQVDRAVGSSGATFTMRIKLNNHALGSYPIYYMVRNKQGIYQTGSTGAEWWKSSYQITVSQPPTATPTQTNTPVPTNMPTATATRTPTRTPTTPPNNAPRFVDASLAPQPIDADGTLTIMARFSDAQGAGTIKNVYLGLAPCGAATYALGMSRFENNLANFIGMLGYTTNYGNVKFQALDSAKGECSGIKDGASAWASTAPLNNSFGTASIQSVTYSPSGNILTVTVIVKLNDFPDGLYNLYYAVMDDRGVFQNGQTTGIWNKATASTQLTVNPSPGEVDRLNEYRALANLAGVITSDLWNTGNVQHAYYEVKNDVLTHQEESGKPWYTIEGAAAGQASVILGTPRMGLSDKGAITTWMSGPFHALLLLDPRLQKVGFGSYRENDGYFKNGGAAGIQMAAGLDVYRGIDYFANATFPVIYPANGKTIFLNAYTGGEYPDPLSSCQGYTAPTGAPIMVQFGSGSTAVALTASSLKKGTMPVDFCIYTEKSYTNSDSQAQSQGRSILGLHDAVVVIPKSPLEKGKSYTLSLTVNGSVHTSTFTVSANAWGNAAVSFNFPAYSEGVCVP